MNLILATPLEMRLVVVFVLGALLGSLANWGIYGLAWNPRPISPWTWPGPTAPRRRLWDRLPILGWLGLRREAGLHGPGFWIRPMLLELLAGFGLAALYWWEIRGGLLPAYIRGALSPDVLTMVHLEFVAHTILLVLMLIGSMIDVDETIIPDEVTVSGTLIGLLMAAAWPWSLLPHVPLPDPVFNVSLVNVTLTSGVQPTVQFLQLTSPYDWPDMLDGLPHVGSLCIGLACWAMWCVAILPRTWYSRHGWRRATQLMLARVYREPSSRRILRMAVMGVLAIALVWYQNTPGWQGLLSALVGMAAGGGLIWLVRVSGKLALGREAMGFGDVTLMAMIGAFLGWQSSQIIFFLAPVAALLVGVVRAIVLRDREIPYGPFLCLAALFLIVFWDGVWQWAQPVFEFGWLVPAVMLACPVLMGVMLVVWRLILALLRLMVREPR